MNRTSAKLSMLAMSAVFLVGCNSGTYQTNATDTQLSAYAGQANYPEVQSTKADDLFAVVAPDSTITIYNAGDTPLNNLELWVNKRYTLHVNKLDAKSMQSFSPNQLYNKSGTNLGGMPANSFVSIQIFADGKLWDVRGPILQH